MPGFRMRDDVPVAHQMNFCGDGRFLYNCQRPGTYLRS